MAQKPGGVSFGCPAGGSGTIDLEQLCHSLGEIIDWLQDIKKMCDSLPDDVRTREFKVPERQG